MHELVQMVNRHVPVPAQQDRRRMWVQPGQVLAFRGGVVLGLERVRDGDDAHLVLQFTAQHGEAVLPHSQLIQIGDVAMVPRAIAWRGDVPVALMIELAAEPHALYRAIEAAA